ncbi:hypothetical protein TPA0907_56400 [Micromonospora humidisoli]|nr:hypothetical protein TPA0907_56400 [Micromonospora sp. AKA109]
MIDHSSCPGKKIKNQGLGSVALGRGMIDSGLLTVVYLAREIAVPCPALVPPASAFTGFRFPPEVIVLAVRWYLRFNLSYRDVEELLVERCGCRQSNPSWSQPSS